MNALAALRDRLRDARRADEGMSLVELLVYSVILGIVMVLIGSLLINGLTTQRDVSGRTQAVNTMQNAFAAVERSVRNASGGYVDAGGTLLVVRERTAASVAAADDWRCVGYYLDESAGVLRRILDDSGTQTAAALAAPNAATVAGTWPEFVPGASRIGTAPAFGAGLRFS